MKIYQYNVNEIKLILLPIINNRSALNHQDHVANIRFMALIRLVSKENFVKFFCKIFCKIFDTCPNFQLFWTHPKFFYCYCDEQFYKFHFQKMFESINVRVAYDISFANCKLQKSTQYNYSH